MNILAAIQSLLTKEDKQFIDNTKANQKTDEAPKTNENKEEIKQQEDVSFWEIYGTIHMYI